MKQQRVAEMCLLTLYFRTFPFHSIAQKNDVRIYL